MGTFAVTVGTTDTFYALAAARASAYVCGPKVGLWSRRVVGGVLIAAGLRTTLSKK